MDDEEMEDYLQRIRQTDEQQNIEEDDEDWVLDDEFTVRSRSAEHAEGGTIADLLASMQEPHLPPSPDAEPNRGWLYDLAQDDPRYSETHNLHAEMLQRLAHKTEDSHSTTFLDQMNKSYR